MTCCDFFLERGEDFVAEVLLTDVGNHPIPVEDCGFQCEAVGIMTAERFPIECFRDKLQFGIVTLHIPHHMTYHMRDDAYRFRLFMTFSSGRRLEVLEGKLRVRHF